jgi:hypothetical protein
MPAAAPITSPERKRRTSRASRSSSVDDDKGRDTSGDVELPLIEEPYRVFATLDEEELKKRRILELSRGVGQVKEMMTDFNTLVDVLSCFTFTVDFPVYQR